MDWLRTARAEDSKRAWAKVYELMCPRCSCELTDHPNPTGDQNITVVQCSSTACGIVYMYERR